MPQRFRASLLAVAFLLSAAAPLSAQTQGLAPAPKSNVISANPFGLLFGLFNAEYERALSPSTTAGVGGSTITLDGDRYLNLDAFFRFYPSATPFEGFALGAKLGMTSANSSTYLGYGVDVNYSWLLGASDNLYVGIGFGLKRLVGNDLDTKGYIPTVRLVNVGLAF